ncbi:MAG: SDR family NAD(P)-dependent oxidoreductase [Pseudomonadota bacterium]
MLRSRHRGEAYLGHIVALDDRIALVTGAGRGIGRAVALALARQGTSVVVADLDGEAAHDTAAAVANAGGRAHGVAIDLAHVGRIDRLFGEVVEVFATLDILVNNAAVLAPHPLLEYHERDWDRQLAVNLKACFFCTQAAARIMIPRRRGKIVNVTSTSAFVSSASPQIVYDASQAGIRQLTVSAAAELAPYGINVNAVAPGTIVTDMNRKMLDTEEKRAAALVRIPLGRLGKPEDVVGPILFLCLPESDYITGHTLVVDGGSLLY